MKKEFIYWLSEKDLSIPLQNELKYKKIFSSLKFSAKKQKEKIKIFEEEKRKIVKKNFSEKKKDLIQKIKKTKQEQIFENLIYEKLKQKRKILEKDLTILKKRKYVKKEIIKKFSEDIKKNLLLKKEKNLNLQISKKKLKKKILKSEKKIEEKLEIRNRLKLKNNKKKMILKDIRFRIKNNLKLVQFQKNELKNLDNYYKGVNLKIRANFKILEQGKIFKKFVMNLKKKNWLDFDHKIFLRTFEKFQKTFFFPSIFCLDKKKNSLKEKNKMIYKILSMEKNKKQNMEKNKDGSKGILKDGDLCISENEKNKGGSKGILKGGGDKFIFENEKKISIFSKGKKSLKNLESSKKLIKKIFEKKKTFDKNYYKNNLITTKKSFSVKKSMKNSSGFFFKSKLSKNSTKEKNGKILTSRIIDKKIMLKKNEMGLKKKLNFKFQKKIKIKKKKK